MNFNFVEQPFFQKILQAICLTLIHSLWQGAILALLAGLVLILSKRSKPAWRYNLLSGLLFVFVTANILTFFIQFSLSLPKSKNVSNALMSISNYDSGNVANPTTQITHYLSRQHLFEMIIAFCSNHSVLIVTIWFLVFCFKSAQATAGFIYIQRIRHSKTHEPSGYWKDRLQILSRKLGINEAVLFFESEIISVPAVIGFLKPVILIPIGFLTSLPSNQIEAILLHELAHIKRRDYLMNLLQTFGEAVYFFNPAVVWISGLIREEREHCCDDLAISILANKTSFINALVSFQEYKLAQARLEMTFAAGQNHLLNRIKRIINNNNKSLNAMEKLFVTAGLITVTLFSVAFSPSTPEKKPKSFPTPKRMIATQATPKTPPAPIAAPLPTAVPAIENDTIPGSGNTKIKSGVSTIHVTRNNKRYEMVETNGKVTELIIDGVSIPEEQRGQYKTEIESIIKEVEESREQAEVMRKEAEKMRKQADEMREQAEVMRVDAEKFRADNEKMRKEADEMRKQAEVMRVDAEKSRANNEVMRKEADEMRKQAEVMRVEATKSRDNAEVMRKEAEVMRKEAEVMRVEAEKSRIAFQKKQDNLINDLITEGVIKDRDNLSYKLNAEELIVNGVKQPAAVHQKLRSKYLENSSAEFTRNFNGRSGYSIKK
ncbi:M56 family metallopeptidase [Runella sp.]|uniref:M56 family metallopeptidase n=1 Tax=Runella sp. TaxID=1960881 RepID=UPI003D1275D1